MAYVGEEYPLEILVKGCQCDFGSSCPADAEEGKQEEGTMDEEVEVVMDVLLQPVESDVTAGEFTLFPITESSTYGFLIISFRRS